MCAPPSPSNQQNLLTALGTPEVQTSLLQLRHEDCSRRKPSKNLVVVLVSSDHPIKILPKICPNQFLNLNHVYIWEHNSLLCLHGSRFIKQSTVLTACSLLVWENPISPTPPGSEAFSDSESIRAEPKCPKIFLLSLCLLACYLMCLGLSFWRPPWAWTFHPPTPTQPCDISHNSPDPL